MVCISPDLIDSHLPECAGDDVIKCEARANTHIMMTFYIEILKQMRCHCHSAVFYGCCKKMGFKLIQIFKHEIRLFGLDER